ncbi:hypothetical protein [Streptomyces olivochromogenes]|uniref:hypothetical protein n=1 Tax=Streptomyces olivochromogenes TaxID=1963 RepID=UPI001F210655|nr:hypothetical protein [Streptomyces olivochromogenes]
MDCFPAAAVLFSPRMEPVQIPSEDTTLPGCLYRADTSGEPRPTVVMHNGFDGAAEERAFFGAMAGVERGYTVLAFDGPGQPGPCTAKVWSSAPSGRTWWVRCWTSP